MATVKNPNGKAFIDLWLNAKNRKPELVNKENPHFDTSNVLLLDNGGSVAIPGYYVKWNRGMYKGAAGHTEIKKGDTFYYSLKGDLLVEGVLFFYPIDLLPLKSAQIEPKNTENSENPE